MKIFAPWMISNLAAGATQMSFVTLLIPPFITKITGSPLRGSVVLAIIGLAALTGPAIGKFADKHKAHQWLYMTSLLGMALGFVALAVDAAVNWYSPIAGLIIGASMAAQATIGPAFIVGVGDSKTNVARKLTIYNILYPIGQVFGALVIVVGLLLGLAGQGLFWLAVDFLAISAIFSLPGLSVISKKVSTTLTANRQKVNFKKAMSSSFGLFLLAATLGAIANGAQNAQIANILPNVYGFSQVQTAAIIAIAGFLSIGALIYAGKLLQKQSSTKVYFYGATIKFVGMAAMAVVGVLTGQYLLLATSAVLVAYQGPQLTRLASPSLAARLASFAATQANGYYFATSALGAFLGSLAGGYLAQFVSYNAINLFNATLAGAAVLLIIMFLSPKNKILKEGV